MTYHPKITQSPIETIFCNNISIDLWFEFWQLNKLYWYEFLSLIIHSLWNVNSEFMMTRPQKSNRPLSSKTSKNPTQNLRTLVTSCRPSLRPSLRLSDTHQTDDGGEKILLIFCETYSIKHLLMHFFFWFYDVNELNCKYTSPRI